MSFLQATSSRQQLTNQGLIASKGAKCQVTFLAAVKMQKEMKSAKSCLSRSHQQRKTSVFFLQFLAKKIPTGFSFICQQPPLQGSESSLGKYAEF